MRLLQLLPVCVLALCAFPGLLSADALVNLSQTIVLRPGWNAVFLRVDAPHEQLERLLRNAKISEVVARTTGLLPGTRDSQGLTSRSPQLGDKDWSNDQELWTSRPVDPSNDANIASAAAALSPGRCYVLRSSIEGQRVEAELSGVPVFRRQVWRGVEGALFGAHVEEDEPPSVRAYFAPSPVLGGATADRAGIFRGAEFFALETAGGWRRLRDLDAETLNRDSCLFVRAPGLTDYQGPLDIRPESGEELAFARGLTERALHLSNRTGEPMRVVLESPRIASSAEASPDDSPWPLLFAHLPAHGDDTDPWVSIDGGGLELTLPPKSNRYLRLGANVPAASAWHSSQVGEGGHESVVRSILTVRGDGGLRFSIPLSIAVGVELDASEFAGLWAGEVMVDGVSFASPRGGQGNTIQPVETPYGFRMLVHRSNDGMCRLLSHAYELFGNVDGEDTSILLVDESKAFELSDRSDFELRRRFAAVTYVTAGAIRPEPAGETQHNQSPCLSRGSSVSFRIVLEHYDDRHPDVHARHRDHDNLNEHFDERLPEGAESSRIERVFTLRFDPEDDLGTYSPYWSETRRRGRFDEEIAGIHKWPLRTSGYFELGRVSRADLVVDAR